MVTVKVSLQQGNSNQLIEATLLDLETRHVNSFQQDWKPLLRQFLQVDKYWDWVFKQRSANNRGNYECSAIEANGKTQGLMMLETRWHKSRMSANQPLVFVEAISAAPWNRAQVGRLPQFRRVGSVLLEFARTRSEALGYEGRVGLESLPEAEGFYESRNMMRFEPEIDPYVDDELPLVYFEYPPSRRQNR
ncbi:MAG: GNAT family N-acetyltransferase [Cyanobacteria bacterium J06627_32]